MSRNTVPEEVKEFTHEVRRFSASADFDGLMKCYADIPSFIAVTGNGGCYSYDAFKAICRDFYEDLESQSLETQKEEFYPLERKIILSVWQGQIEAFLSDGSRMNIEHYAVSTIITEVDESWKIVHSHESGTSPQFSDED